MEGEPFVTWRDRFGAVEGTHFMSGGGTFGAVKGACFVKWMGTFREVEGGMSRAIGGVGLLICACVLSQFYDHTHDRQSARGLA